MRRDDAIRLDNVELNFDRKRLANIDRVRDTAFHVSDANCPQARDLVTRRLERIRPFTGGGGSQPGVEMRVHDEMGRAILHDTATVQQNGTVAQPSDGRHIVGDEQNGPPRSTDILHLVKTLFWKTGTAYRQHFIDD